MSKPLKKHFGQFFTTHQILLDTVKNLVRNTHGKVLEPSCGQGHIVKHLVDSGDSRPFTCIEIDDSLDFLLQDHDNITHLHQDFLEYVSSNTATRYSTIVGNPPYVKRKNKCNIYIEFIDKCVDLLEEDGGELILVIPSDFWQLTSASAVKTKMLNMGMFTDVFRANNETLFQNASQDVVVFRYIRTREILLEKIVDFNGTSKNLVCSNGNIFFQDLNPKSGEHVPLKQLFDIKVGMVSGADGIFRNDKLGNTEILTSTGVRKFIQIDEWNHASCDLKKYLNEHKCDLISRRIKKFNESNWYKWGCPRNVTFMEKEKGQECIYCVTLTRKLPVFFQGVVEPFDGSLLCLLPKTPAVNIKKFVEYLNKNEFLSNFKYAGRYKMGQKTLSDILVPINELTC